MSAALAGFAKFCVARHPRDSSRILETFPADQVSAFLSELPQADLARVIAAVDPRLALPFLAGLSPQQRATVFSVLPATSAVALARRLAPEERDQLMRSLPEELRHSMEVTLRCPDDSAGAVADPSVLTLCDDWAVEHALSSIRQQDVPVAPVLFVVDRSQRLKGALTPGQLLTADPKASIGRLELQVPHAVTAETPVSALAVDSRREPVAVVDADGIVIGVVSVETLASLGLDHPNTSIVHPIAALGELYWIGLREALGGLSSGRPRELETAGESNE